ncbi:hypothetical protein Ari01nite_94690 [Paractinoplanes rishiriensis]|uniref:Uncharacterized protein n=1 Tax=Paractinoplanes rishiriensis TaxID=1050105 RepID=A0A919KAZ9_9ACTN|nr:hypothetical protein Ari01nite_94690 [Actinoplanes rishiriensis]
MRAPPRWGISDTVTWQRSLQARQKQGVGGPAAADGLVASHSPYRYETLDGGGPGGNSPGGSGGEERGNGVRADAGGDGAGE